ncbi:MAG TPA: carboxypeptidase-like regulatory domain-containing protein, partial [Puia sp.]
MNTNDKYKHYSAADIQKYLQGDLSAREMQALEAAALEDPFLADALEGIENDRSLRGETPFHEDMAALKDRLDRRLTQKDKTLVMPLYRSVWKVAAAVILLAGLGSIAYRYLLNGRPSTQALASTPTDKKIGSADSITTFRSKPGNTDQDKTDSAITFAPSFQSQDRAKEETYKAKTIDADELISPDRKAVAAEPASADSTASEMLANATPPPAAPAHTDHYLPALRADTFRKYLFKSVPPIAADKKESFGSKDFKASGVGAASAPGKNAVRAGQFLMGKVTDDNNNPIPLITISISGHQQAVRTDTNGLFRIQMLGSDSATHIRIGSTGFESVEVPAYVLTDKSANGGLANTIRLQSQFEGSDYSNAMAYGRTRKNNAYNTDNAAANNAATQKNIVQQAVPVSGWTAYKNYLEKNKMTPSIDSTRKGTEAISFKVSKKGHLSSFRIESSISPAHDSLLLHLIKHGSAWKPLNG